MNTIEQHCSQTSGVRIFIAGGFGSKTSCNDVVRLSEKKVCGVLAHRKSMNSSYMQKFSFPLWLYDSIDNSTEHFPTTSFHKEYGRCLDGILSDPRTFYLAERVYGVGGHSSVFNHTVRIDAACWNSLSILGQTNPDRIVYMSVTHHLQTWIFGRTAELLGIPVYLIGYSPIPGRVWAVRGIDTQEIVSIHSKDDVVVAHAKPSAEVAEYLELNARDYDSAIPADSRELQKEHRGRVWSWRSELKKSMSRYPLILVNNLLRLYRKRRLFLTYNQLTAPIPDRPYVVFFLHYQPEATTLPLGYSYVQQWLAIRAIAETLPDDWWLVVKEHPGTFWFPLVESVRDENIYKAIHALPRTVLASLDSDPFSLIDNSVAVATLTGTAGFQALCRGRSVLAFGAAPYRECPGVFPVKGISQVREALLRIAGGKCAPTRTQLEEYLAWVERISVKGEYDGVDSSGKELAAFRNAKRKAWERLITLDKEEPSTVSFLQSDHDNESTNSKP